MRTYFYRFFSTALVSHLSPESKNVLAVDREALSLQYFFSHLFLSARYRPFQSSWRKGLFSPAIPTFNTHNPLRTPGVTSEQLSQVGIFKHIFFELPGYFSIICISFKVIWWAVQKLCFRGSLGHLGSLQVIWCQDGIFRLIFVNCLCIFHHLLKCLNDPVSGSEFTISLGLLGSRWVI